MKTVLVLSVLLCAALAAPAEGEEKSPEMPVKLNQQPAAALEEQPAAAPAEEMPNKDENGVPGGSRNKNMPAQGDGSDRALRNARIRLCPDGWLTFDYRCYIFVNSPMNWYSAQVHCNSMDANLASVRSPREYIFLQEMTKTEAQTIAWLGGFYLQNQWLWINNDGFYYTNWYSQATATANPCMYLSSAYGWRNIQCTSSQRFICSKSPFSC